MEKTDSSRSFRFDAGERVGCLSAVNQQLSEEGLLRVLPPNPLVSEATALRQQSRTLSSPIPRIKQKELVEVAEVR